MRSMIIMIKNYLKIIIIYVLKVDTRLFNLIN